jgi:histidinol phosphatase-like PHP family hydrolase
LAQLNALLCFPIDILGHPFRQLASIGPVPDEIIDETLRCAQIAGVAIEINAHMPCQQDAMVLARAVARKLPIAFSLDAHHRDELAQFTYFEKVVAESRVNLDDIRFFQSVRRSAEPPSLVR